MLPAWLNTRDPEAVRGTARVRAVDPNLLVGFNAARNQFEIWGPHYRSGGELGNGWGCIVPVTDDRGIPYRGPVPWDRITVELCRLRAAADRAAGRAVQAMAERNARRRQAAERDLSTFQQEAARYFAEPIAREADGDGRWKAADVLRGFRQKWV
jgi:hypothetical protein